jgi:lysozyme
MKGVLGRFGLILSLLVITALFVGTLWLAANRWRPSTSDYHYQGIDVSDRTGGVDWDAMKAAGASFAYIEATASSDTRDSRFEDNWRGADSAGLRRGAMHLYSLCAPGGAQADLFNTVVPVGADDLPAAVELSDVGCATLPAHDALIADLAKFLARIEAHTGKPALVLAPRSIERRYGISAAIARPVWSAGNLFTPNYASRPWRMWRANDMRRVDGIEGPVNWDVVAP